MSLTCEEHYGYQFEWLKWVEQSLLDIIREYPTESYLHGSK